MRSTRPVVVGLVAVLLGSTAGLAACSKQPSDDDLVAALRTSGIARDQAECVVDKVEDVLDAQDIESLVERGSSGAPRDDPDSTDDKADQLRDAMAECRALPGASSTTTTVTVPIDEGTTTPTIRGGLPSESTSTTAQAGDGASIETTSPD